MAEDDLDGKVVLVTEATDGMGRALAVELAGQGATGPRAGPVSTVAEGVAATMHQITADVGGGRYFRGPREARADSHAGDPAARRQLREVSRQLAGTGSARPR